MSQNNVNDAARGTTGAGPTALARSVAFHMEGKRKEALAELNGAIEAGDQSPEILAAKGHIQFELEQFEDAESRSEPPGPSPFSLRSPYRRRIESNHSTAAC